MSDKSVYGNLMCFVAGHPSKRSRQPDGDYKRLTAGLAHGLFHREYAYVVLAHTEMLALGVDVGVEHLVARNCVRAALPAIRQSSKLTSRRRNVNESSLPSVSMAVKSASGREMFSTRSVRFTRCASISDSNRHFVALELNRAWSVSADRPASLLRVATMSRLDRVPSRTSGRKSQSGTARRASSVRTPAAGLWPHQ
jgi:hypothetical protein